MLYQLSYISPAFLPGLTNASLACNACVPSEAFCEAKQALAGKRQVQSLERETGIEPATNSLEGCDSTTELLPPSSCSLKTPHQDTTSVVPISLAFRKGHGPSRAVNTSRIQGP